MAGAFMAWRSVTSITCPIHGLIAGRPEYELPARWVGPAKVVELPDAAGSVKLTERPPAGPMQVVR